MAKIIAKFIEGDYEITRYSDEKGNISEIKVGINGEKLIPKQPTPQPTLEDKVNFLYYKQIGVI